MIPDSLHFSLSGLLGARPRVVELELPILSAPAALLGKRLLFATDIHASWMYPRRAAGQLVEQIEALAPDMILWGGDFAESGARLGGLLSMVSRLRPPMGMAAVLGNNDVEQMDVHTLRSLMAQSGIRLLVNEALRLPVSGGSLLILGLDEPKYRQPDLSILDEPCEPREVRIVLAHSPLALHHMQGTPKSPPALILCGHTHGGQVSVGGLSVYDIGYERTRRSQYFHRTGTHRLSPETLMVVSNGIGTSLLPIRLGAPPELHMVKIANVCAPN